MSLIKSNEAAFHSLSLATHGQVDIGALQATGVVSAAATKDVVVNGKNLTARTNLTITVVGTAPKVGHTLRIAGTTNYNGNHPIIEVIDATHYVIDVTFVSDQSGTWTSLGAKGFFVGFIPMTDIAAGEITSITYLKPEETSHVGDPTKVAYIAGVYYPFPGGIDEIVLSAGNIRLFRYSNNKPQF